MISVVFFLSIVFIANTWAGGEKEGTGPATTAGVMSADGYK